MEQRWKVDSSGNKQYEAIFHLVQDTARNKMQCHCDAMQDTTSALQGLQLDDHEHLLLRNTNLLRPDGDPIVKQTISFLVLPAEIRNVVYHDVLVSRLDGERTGRARHVMIHLIPKSQRTQMGAGLLRTCRQIHEEANSILYSENTFQVRESEDMLRFIDAIGPSNFAYIKSVHIWVPYHSRLNAWLQLLRILADSAKGLRSLVIGWGADIHLGRAYPERGSRGRGLGDNLDFVRALSKIQGLEELIIEGFYAMRWPAFLEEKMNVAVQEHRGYASEEPYDFEGSKNDVDSLARHRRWVRNQRSMFARSHC